MSSQNTSSQTAKFCWMRLSRFSRAHTIPFSTPKWRYFLCQCGWGIWEESNRQAQSVSAKEVLGFLEKLEKKIYHFGALGNHVFGLNVLVSNYFLLILYAPQVSTKVASIQPYITRRRYTCFFWRLSCRAAFSPCDETAVHAKHIPTRGVLWHLRLRKTASSAYLACANLWNTNQCVGE